MAKAGMCTIAFSEKTVFEAIDIAKKAGAEGIEIWGKPPHIVYPIDPEQLAQIKEHAKRQGLIICALGSYYRPGALTSISGIELTFESQIEVAKLLGTRIIRIWPGDKDYDDFEHCERETVYNEIRRCAKLAGVEGIKVVLERHKHTLLNRWDNVVQILKELDHPNVFLNYQIVFPASVSEYREKSIADYRTLLPYSAHMHLQNYALSPEGELQRTFLSDGVVNYSDLVRAAGESGYSGYFMVEFTPVLSGFLNAYDSIRRDINWIKEQ